MCGPVYFIEGILLAAVIIVPWCTAMGALVLLMMRSLVISGLPCLKMIYLRSMCFVWFEFRVYNPFSL